MLKALVRDDCLDELRRSCESGALDAEELCAGLVEAVELARESMVRVLVAHGADPNRVPRAKTWAAIHTAVELGRLNILEFLLKSGGDPNLRDAGGFTPLHLAVDVEADSALQMDSSPKTELLKLLLSLGSLPDVQNCAGRTPVDIARDYGFVGALDLFSKFGSGESSS